MAAPPAEQQQPTRPEDMISEWAKKYRGVCPPFITDSQAADTTQATVEDLDPPAALSTSPKSPISHALISAFEREYTHLTVLSTEDRALLGYLSIPHLKELLQSGAVKDTDPVEKAMTRFQRRGRKYRLITMETPLEELEAFFEGANGGLKQDFAVVTDAGRRFVLGVATRGDLAEFVRRRPA